MLPHVIERRFPRSLLRLELLLPLAALAFALFLAIIVLLADERELGALHRVYDFRYGDKVGHFVLYGFLAFLVQLAVLHRGDEGGQGAPDAVFDFCHGVRRSQSCPVPVSVWLGDGCSV